LFSQITGQGNNTEVPLKGGESVSESSKKGNKEYLKELKAPIVDLEKRLQSKTINLTGQNNTQHQAVLRFLYYQRIQQHMETRQSIALKVARCFN